MRRVASTLCVSVTTASTLGSLQPRRTFFCFTNQSPALIEEQKLRGFKSDFWVGLSTALRQRCELRPGEKPVKANKLPKAVELYNLDDMTVSKEFSTRIGHTDSHSSITNKKTYQAEFQKLLEERSRRHGFTSKWWIGRWSAWKEGGEFQPMANPRLCRILVDWSEPMVNMDQIKHSDNFTNLCYDGGMAEHFGMDSNKLIYQTQKQFKDVMCTPAVFYSVHQCEKLGLKVDDSKAFIFNNLQQQQGNESSNANTQPNWMYNWSEFEGWENADFIRRKLSHKVHLDVVGKRFSPQPYYGLSGREVKGQHIHNRIAALVDSFPVNVWLFEFEVKKLNLKLTNNRRPYQVKGRVNAIKQMDQQATSAEKTSLFLPLEHLEDPEMGKKCFGTISL